MNKYILFLISIIVVFVSSCNPPLGATRRFVFKFANNSDTDIYIVVDNNPSDDIITTGSRCFFIYAGNCYFVDSEIPWGDIIKESAYIYVIDASLAKFSQGSFLSLEECGAISQDMILDRITVYHEDFLKMFTVSYPY